MQVDMKSSPSAQFLVNLSEQTLDSSTPEVPVQDANGRRCKKARKQRKWKLEWWATQERIGSHGWCMGQEFWRRQENLRFRLLQSGTTTSLATTIGRKRGKKRCSYPLRKRRLWSRFVEKMASIRHPIAIDSTSDQGGGDYSRTPLGVKLHDNDIVEMRMLHNCQASHCHWLIPTPTSRRQSTSTPIIDYSKSWIVTSDEEKRKKEKKLRSLEETDVNEVSVRSSSNKPNHVWEWSLVGQLQHVIVSPMPISLYVTYTMLTLRPIANPG